MPFQSSAVSVQWVRNSLIMARAQSQLIIKAEDIQALFALKEFPEFSEYFRTKALVNREARRVFEAWERKDKDLLPKLHVEVLANP